jgi:putative addiction module component (TIGR02574 family)
MTTLTSEALRLPPEERLKLIGEVWNSFVSDPASLPATSEEIEEMERRRKQYEAEPNSLTDWEELKAQLRLGRDDAH